MLAGQPTGGGNVAATTKPGKNTKIAPMDWALSRKRFRQGDYGYHG
jgi:hypothetical protein